MNFAPYHPVFKHIELLNSYSDIQKAQRTWCIHSCSQSRVKSLACKAKFYGGARFITIIFWLPPSCYSVKKCDHTFLKVWPWDPLPLEWTGRVQNEKADSWDWLQMMGTLSLKIWASIFKCFLCMWKLEKHYLQLYSFPYAEIFFFLLVTDQKILM